VVTEREEEEVLKTDVGDGEADTVVPVPVFPVPVLDPVPVLVGD